MLTRQAIDSGEYLEHFVSLPNLWTTDRIERSLAETMKSKPAQTDEVWIFAYGSLMWNPMLQFDQRQVATLHGWHRSFCLHMDVGRGSPELPGRMLALESGGHTQGFALKLCPSTMADELRRVWIREMVLGSYRPVWAPVTLDDGTETQAIAFTADTTEEPLACAAGLGAIRDAADCRRRYDSLTPVAAFITNSNPQKALEDEAELARRHKLLLAA